MINEGLNLKGKVFVTLTNKDGQTLCSFEKNNLITTVGKSFVASRIVANTAAAMSYIAIGSNNTAPGAGDTTLTTESARVSATTGSTGADATFSAVFGAGVGTGTVAEAGLFNANLVGTMLSHVNGLSVSKGASDTLTITWTVSVA